MQRETLLLKATKYAHPEEKTFFVAENNKSINHATCDTASLLCPAVSSLFVQLPHSH